jgi:hypothetical protein
MRYGQRHSLRGRYRAYRCRPWKCLRRLRIRHPGAKKRRRNPSQQHAAKQLKHLRNAIDDPFGMGE